MSRFSRLTEAQIQKAKAEGQFDGLEGEGKPLPERVGEGFQDAGLAVGLRAMSQAGVLPEEIEIRKILEAAKARYAAAKSDEEKRAIMHEISDLNLKYEMAREARKSFFR